MTSQLEYVSDGDIITADRQNDITDYVERALYRTNTKYLMVGDIIVIDALRNAIVNGLTIGSLNGLLKASNGVVSTASANTDYLIDLSNFTTSNLIEGTNLYFTNARAQTALSSHTSDSSIHFTQGNISVTESQVSDLKNYFDKDVDTSDSVTDTATNRFTNDIDISRLANTSGTNTGDQDLSGLVPYTGATTNVDLGANSITTKEYISNVDNILLYRNIDFKPTGIDNIGIGDYVFGNKKYMDKTGAGGFSGHGNISIGNKSSINLISGQENIALGNWSLYSNNVDSYNIGIGYFAGGTTPTGAFNYSKKSIYIGGNTKGGRINSDGTIENEIVIGDSAIGNKSNTVTIGNDAITHTYLKGIVTANNLSGTNTGDQTLPVNSDFNLADLGDVDDTDKAEGKILKVNSEGKHVYVADESGTDEKVKYDVSDPTAGYIADKFVAGTGISLAEGTGANENKLLITNSDLGSSAVTTHEGTYDHSLIATALQSETDPLSLHLDQTTPQTITNGIPLLTGLTPTTDYQISTKKYVDDSIALAIIDSWAGSY